MSSKNNFTIILQRELRRDLIRIQKEDENEGGTASRAKQDNQGLGANSSNPGHVGMDQSSYEPSRLIGTRVRLFLPQFRLHKL